jgi:hypothetical protein
MPVQVSDDITRADGGGLNVRVYADSVHGQVISVAVESTSLDPNEDSCVAEIDLTTDETLHLISLLLQATVQAERRKKARI